MKNFLLLLLIIMLVSCSRNDKSADKIIENAIQYHGGAAYDSLDVSYTFRDKKYTLKHNNGLFTYERIFEDSTGNLVEDVLTNEGFNRKIKDKNVVLSMIDSTAYANSVNSVHYFALLPFGLDVDAVVSEKLANTTIGGKEYFTIKVTFQQEGGGKDFEDEFVYWFDTADYSMDFMAYSYHTEGGGVRFREAYNPREVQGVIFQDYKNYEADKNAALSNLPEQFGSGQLKLLSKIDLNFIEEN